jgi:hypothetical protein
LVSQFRVPYNKIAFGLIVLSTSVGTALAEESLNPNAPNQSAAALHSAQLVNTPDKKQKWLRERYHMVMSQQWPVNFPVPVYPSNVTQTSFSNSTQGQPRAAATLITKDAPGRVFDFYQSALNRAKWTVRLPSGKARAEMNLGSDFYFLTAEQGSQSIYLTCAGNQKTNATYVNITWQKNR